MDPFTIGAIAQGVGGIISGINGISQRRQAKRMLRSLQRPQYNIPNEVLQNQKMAEQAAQQGLPSQQYAQAMQNISRQQNQALQASRDRRGGLMTVAQNQQSANDALLNLDVANANARMQNQQTLYGINNQVAGYRDKAFDINRMQPYQRDYQYANSLLGAGNQNIMGGIDRLLGAGAGVAGGKQMWNSQGLFGNGQSANMGSYSPFPYEGQ